MSHADRPDPESVRLENGQLAATVEDVFKVLDSQSIVHQSFTHEPLYTVEQAKAVSYTEPGAHTKNLFLRNKKGRMFLVVVEPDHQVDLRGLRELINVPGGQIAFASTDRLARYLGVVPGSVSPLAVINDHDNAVQVYMQSSLLEHEWIYLHPCRNTHSTRLKTADLQRLLSFWNHPVTPLDFNGSASAVE